MHISAPADSGNIEVLDASDPNDVRLAIRPDTASGHFQWFHFRIAGARGVPLRLRLTNASASAYPKAWDGYHAVWSVDREHWRREPNTRYMGGELVIEHVPEADVVWFAYFAPYGLDRLAARIGGWQRSPRCRVSTIGRTLDGEGVDLLTIASPSVAAASARRVWVLARQHPGESMASWWVEGFVDRLLDPASSLASSILDRAVVYVVPHMNPDGSRRGHLRTNRAGADLNREWHAPSVERSPEVLAARAAMDQRGVDLCLDVHGDEELPYNFVSGAEGTPSWSPRKASLQAAFLDAYREAAPDFQLVHGYPIAGPGEANLTMCTNQVAERYDCLAMTLEMPFKDNFERPDPAVGWSPERCRALGADALLPIARVLGSLR